MSMNSGIVVRILRAGSFVLLLCTSVVLKAGDNPLSEAALQGEKQIAVCNACHDATLNPSKAPPLWGVQRRYQKQYADKESFVEAMVNFVSNPTEDSALMNGPVRMLGLMPALPLGDGALGQVASYIYEENFEPPCDHWTSALSLGKGRGKGHRGHVEDMIEQYCQ